HGDLVLHVQLEAALVRALQPHLEGQAHRGRAAGVHLPGQRERADRAPGGGPAARGRVPVGDLRRGEPRGHRERAGERRQDGDETSQSIRHGTLAMRSGVRVHSTSRPSAWKAPIITLTRSPGRTKLPLLENAIQYSLPAVTSLVWRSGPTFSIVGTCSSARLRWPSISGASALSTSRRASAGSTTR